MKRIIIFILAISMCVGLFTGCGSTSAPESSSTDTQTTNVTQATNVTQVADVAGRTSEQRTSEQGRSPCSVLFGRAVNSQVW